MKDMIAAMIGDFVFAHHLLSSLAQYNLLTLTKAAKKEVSKYDETKLDKELPNLSLQNAYSNLPIDIKINAFNEHRQHSEQKQMS